MMMKILMVFEYIVLGILIIVFAPFLLLGLVLKWTIEGVDNGAAPH
jgi:hypothetical protein